MNILTYKNDSKEVKHLIQKDPQLKDLFSNRSEITVTLEDDYFVSLAGIIIAQQLSSKVAKVIYNRFEQLLEKEMTPEKIESLSDESMRSIGLSYQKIKYLRSLAHCILNRTVDLNHLDQLTNQEIIDMLIQIKGIGVWSAEMFLMFTLGREDVFSVLDLGLRNAVKKVYNNPELTAKEIETISQKWAPYRSIVSHYLWHAWDNVPL